MMTRECRRTFEHDCTYKGNKFANYQVLIEVREGNPLLLASFLFCLQQMGIITSLHAISNVMAEAGDLLNDKLLFLRKMTLDKKTWNRHGHVTAHQYNPMAYQMFLVEIKGMKDTFHLQNIDNHTDLIL